MGHKKGRGPDFDESNKNVRLCLWNNKNAKGKNYVYGKIFRYRKKNDEGLKIIDMNGSEFQALKELLSVCDFKGKKKS